MKRKAEYKLISFSFIISAALSCFYQKPVSFRFHLFCCCCCCWIISKINFFSNKNLIFIIICYHFCFYDIRWLLFFDFSTSLDVLSIVASTFLSSESIFSRSFHFSPYKLLLLLIWWNRYIMRVFLFYFKSAYNGWSSKIIK